MPVFLRISLKFLEDLINFPLFSWRHDFFPLSLPSFEEESNVSLSPRMICACLSLRFCPFFQPDSLLRIGHGVIARQGSHLPLKCTQAALEEQIVHRQNSPLLFEWIEIGMEHNILTTLPGQSYQMWAWDRLSILFFFSNSWVVYETDLSVWNSMWRDLFPYLFSLLLAHISASLWPWASPHLWGSPLHGLYPILPPTLSCALISESHLPLTPAPISEPPSLLLPPSSHQERRKEKGITITL